MVGKVIPKNLNPILIELSLSPSSSTLILNTPVVYAATQRHSNAKLFNTKIFNRQNKNKNKKKVQEANSHPPKHFTFYYLHSSFFVLFV